MRELPILNVPPVFIEIGPGSLKALCENRGIELPLERAVNGRLTGAGREKLIAGLKRFLGRKNWQPRARAVCGISAHGVSLRRLTLPAARDDFENVLRLQIEGEFPLPPDELAWGWQDISTGVDKRELLVAAVRKEIIEDCAAALLAAGANPEFTVAALARNALCSPPDAAHAILEITPSHSELVTFENGVEGGLRIFPPGGDLADAVLKNTNAKVIYVSGDAAGRQEPIAKLSARVDCRRLEVSGGDGCSAATLGLKKLVLECRALPWLRPNPKPAKTSFNILRAENRQWLKRAAVLLAVLLIFPFAETLLVKPFLGWRLASFKVRQQKFMAVVDPEMRFLLYLKQNQPPYLDALYVFSKAAPPGTHLDSFSVNQRGEISLKAAIQNGQQVADFRAKLIASGFFDKITVEEQTPVQNQPKVNVRMSAQWKPGGTRPAISVRPADETGKNKNNGNVVPSAAPPETSGSAIPATPPKP